MHVPITHPAAFGRPSAAGRCHDALGCEFEDNLQGYTTLQSLKKKAWRNMKLAGLDVVYQHNTGVLGS